MHDSFIQDSDICVCLCLCWFLFIRDARLLDIHVLHKCFKRMKKKLNEKQHFVGNA